MSKQVDARAQAYCPEELGDVLGHGGIGMWSDMRRSTVIP